MVFGGVVLEFVKIDLYLTNRWHFSSYFPPENNSFPEWSFVPFMSRPVKTAIYQDRKGGQCVRVAR